MVYENDYFSLSTDSISWDREPRDIVLLSNMSNTIHVKVNFLTSDKGQPLLVLNDYVYRCNKKPLKKNYWVWISTGCNIFIQTDSE